MLEAINALTKVGLVKVYNIIDGVSGEKVEDPASVNHGKRMRNGWKNSGFLDLRCQSRATILAMRRKINIVTFWLLNMTSVLVKSMYFLKI
jgi:hypothetical protein